MSCVALSRDSATESTSPLDRDSITSSPNIGSVPTGGLWNLGKDEVWVTVVKGVVLGQTVVGNHADLGAVEGRHRRTPWT